MSFLHTFTVIKLIASWVMMLGLYMGKPSEDGLNAGCMIGSTMFVSFGEYQTDVDGVSLMILGTAPGALLRILC